MPPKTERREWARHEAEANIMYSKYFENPYCYYGAKILNHCENGFYFESKYALRPESLICFNKAIYTPKSGRAKPYELLPVSVKWCHEIDADSGKLYGIGVAYVDPNDMEWENSPAGEVNVNPRDFLAKPHGQINDFGFVDGGKKWYDRIITDLEQAKDIALSKTDDLATLNRFAQAVSSTLDLQDILHAICKEMVKKFGARNTGIGLLDKDQSKISLVAFYSTGSEEKDATGLEIPLSGNASTHYVIETGQTIVVPDVQHNPITGSIHDIFTDRGTQCVMIVPLLSRGEVIGTIGLPTSDPDRIFSPMEVSLAQTIAGQIASAINNARLHAETQKAKEFAERDLEIGRKIQASFFPEKLPDKAGWEIATHFQAARQVAGDFFDAFELPGDNVGLVIGDVCDKGVGSALFMALFRSLLRVFSGQMGLHGLPVVQDEESVCIEIDSQVTCNMEQINALKAVALTNDYIAKEHSRMNMFATLFFGVLDPASGLLAYINGGHEPPFIIRESGLRQKLEPTGVAVGFIPNAKFTIKQVRLEPGDILLGVTDGVTEALSPSGEMFTKERLIELLDTRVTTASGLLKLIKDKLLVHVNNARQADDITMIAVRRSVDR
jgi:serine phosphatase RsbU (regulator of sigma subunit)